MLGVRHYHRQQDSTAYDRDEMRRRHRARWGPERQTTAGNLGAVAVAAAAAVAVAAAAAAALASGEGEGSDDAGF